MQNYNFYTPQINLINIFRKLWQEHVMWTRSFLTSTVFNTPDLDFTTARLLRNPEDFANILKHYYGSDKAAKFEQLFKDHLLIAASLVNNLKAGNTEAAQEDERKWYQNADEIAIFLSSINPYWPKDQWQSLLHDHLKMTKEEASDLLTGQYPASIIIFDEIVNQGLMMADLMAWGIMMQFDV